MTPAMASDPYCAPAPSRSTSTRLTALSGSALKSTGLVPLPVLDSTFTTADTWRRLPLTSTSTWSGLMPRSCAARTWSAAPELLCRGKLNEGSSVCSAAARLPSGPAARRRSSAYSTSIGEAELSTVRSRLRVPVTTMDSAPSAAWATGVATAAAARPSSRQWRTEDSGRFMGAGQ